jgi:hypothetical protein
MAIVCLSQMRDTVLIKTILHICSNKLILRKQKKIFIELTQVIYEFYKHFYKNAIKTFGFNLLDIYILITRAAGDRGNTVVKVLCYKSKGSWFDPSWCQWIFH